MFYQHNRGFTLVELVITVILIGILAAIALPRFIYVADDAEANVFAKQAGNVIEALVVAKAGYAVGDPAGLPPDLDANMFPDHLGDVGDPATMRGFFGGILDYPIKNHGFGSNQGIGWKSVDGWLPLAGSYYYYYDADGDNNYDPAIDSRIFYDPTTGQIGQDGFGAGLL